MENQKSELCDVLIIGSGPAGMEAALVLARTRKKIIVLDAPTLPRNFAANEVHNFLGMDGFPPSKIREISWQQINVYNQAQLIKETATDITKNSAGLFVIKTEEEKTYLARNLLLAFGFIDEYPEVAGFMECWGKTIFPCPFCDGYENRDREWGIIKQSEEEMIHFANISQNWTPRNKVLLNGKAMSTKGREILKQRGTKIYDERIIKIHHVDGVLHGLTLENDQHVELESILWTLPERASPLVRKLVQNLKIELNPKGYIKINEFKETSVPGIWAAGDIQGWVGAIQAAAAGEAAAVAMTHKWFG
ncbi:NAD(P)/FAD-dependent oxidoreductase [Fluviispira sanaruensis]|uniref:NAD(P)/FAD-dependent oxidoreductase n=1 Tax=Fluviispira sanaruensis TaxID=2493639 RepID=A0A4P2VJ35_FLUSA|nr:NAD(P)/FAD-dependent oxidoreductase [Fluviispira sanaruensis]BBH51914.1 NAD(P)/FAD-dependent oxidoreductase [Fluviispira sanaruensis]